MITRDNNSERLSDTSAASEYFSTTSRRNGSQCAAAQTKTRVLRKSARPLARPAASAVVTVTSVAATGGRASTAATPIVPSTIGIRRQTSRPRAETNHHPTISASSPATMTAHCIAQPRNLVLKATSAVKPVTTAR